MSNIHQLPTPFDGYEVHGVREFGRGAKRYCEQVDDSEAQFWSLYGHIPGRGVECIGDFKTREHAEEVCVRITGRPCSAHDRPKPSQTAESSLLDQAFDAFWDVVVKRFPEAKTGDLSPWATIRFELAGRDAVDEWIANNVPAPQRT